MNLDLDIRENMAKEAIFISSSLEALEHDSLRARVWTYFCMFNAPTYTPTHVHLMLPIHVFTYHKKILLDIIIITIIIINYIIKL